MSFYTYKCFYRDLLLYIFHLCPGNDFLNVDTKIMRIWFPKWCSVLVSTLYHCSSLEIYIFLNCKSFKCLEASLKLRMITVSKIISNQCRNYFTDILIGYLWFSLIFQFLNTTLKKKTYFVVKETILVSMALWTCTFWRDVYCEDPSK